MSKKNVGEDTPGGIGSPTFSVHLLPSSVDLFVVINMDPFFDGVTDVSTDIERNYFFVYVLYRPVIRRGYLFITPFLLPNVFSMFSISLIILGKTSKKRMSIVLESSLASNTGRHTWMWTNVHSIQQDLTVQKSQRRMDRYDGFSLKKIRDSRTDEAPRPHSNIRLFLTLVVQCKEVNSVTESPRNPF